MMAGRFLYIVGQPGAGKSTLVKALFEGIPFVQLAGPFAHAVYANGWVQLGVVRDQYPGTDALPYDVSSSVLSWLERARYIYPLIVGEGSRLGTHSFFAGCRRAGLPLQVIQVDVGKEVAAARVTARSIEYGVAHPLPVCLYAWAGKAERVGERWANHRLDGTLPVSDLVAAVNNIAGVVQ